MTDSDAVTDANALKGHFVKLSDKAADGIADFVLADAEFRGDLPASADHIVTVTPTIQDGTVVRWYRSLAAAECGNEVVSASRNAVVVDASIFTSEPGALEELVGLIRVAGHTAQQILAGVDVRRLATHTLTFGQRRSLQPVERIG